MRAIELPNPEWLRTVATFPTPKPERKKPAPPAQPRARTLAPDGVTAAVERLLKSQKPFDRADVYLQVARPYSLFSTSSVMSRYVQRGLAKVVQRGGWWRPSEGGPAKCRPTLWQGTPAARSL